MTDNELLKFAIENGIIDVSSVQSQIEMKRRKDLLEKQKLDIKTEEDRQNYEIYKIICRKGSGRASMACLRGC